MIKLHLIIFTVIYSLIKVRSFPAQTCPMNTKSYSFDNNIPNDLAALPNIITTGIYCCPCNYSNLWYNYFFKYYKSLTVIVNVIKVVSYQRLLKTLQ